MAEVFSVGPNQNQAKRRRRMVARVLFLSRNPISWVTDDCKTRNISSTLLAAVLCDELGWDC